MISDLLVHEVASTPRGCSESRPQLGPLFLVTPHVTCLPRWLSSRRVLAKQLCPVSSHLRVLPHLPGPHSGGLAHEARGGLCLCRVVPGIRAGTFGGRETGTELSRLTAVALRAWEAINQPVPNPLLPFLSFPSFSSNMKQLLLSSKNISAVSRLKTF